MSFPDYLTTIYVPYLDTFRGSEQPRIVLRYEDMLNDPVAFMKEALVFAGSARSLSLSAQGIRTAVENVLKRTKKQATAGAPLCASPPTTTTCCRCASAQLHICAVPREVPVAGTCSGSWMGERVCKAGFPEAGKPDFHGNQMVFPPLD